MSWQRKLAAIKSFKPDVSSVSPSSEQRTTARFAVTKWPCYTFPPTQHHSFLIFFSIKETSIVKQTCKLHDAYHEFHFFFLLLFQFMHSYRKSVQNILKYSKKPLKWLGGAANWKYHRKKENSFLFGTKSPPLQTNILHENFILLPPPRLYFWICRPALT